MVRAIGFYGFSVLVLFLQSPVFGSERPSDAALAEIASREKWELPIRRLVVVVPVYREFYNENLGRLLRSLALQERSNRVPLRTDLVLMVNNTVDVIPGVRTENVETVAYLQALSRGEAPRVRPETQDLFHAIEAVKQSGLILHILDHTTPGFAERNIGRVRDLANRYALGLIPESDDTSTVIAQMDADCVVPPNYSARLQDVFSRGRYEWGTIGLDYRVEPGSRAEVFRRFYLDAFHLAYWEFQAAIKNETAASGSPRIVSLARAIRTIGGVPHATWGEDAQLVARLRERFPGKGVAIANLAVSTNYRARHDSYDGNYFLGNLGKGLEIGSPFRDTFVREISTVESEIASWGPDWEALRTREYNFFYSEWEMETETLRANTEAGLRQLARKQPIELAHRKQPLTRSEWWPKMLSDALSESGGNIERALLWLEKQFPDQLSRSASDRVVFFARTKAATIVRRFHLISPNYFPGGRPQATPTVAPVKVTQPAPGITLEPAVAPLNIRLTNTACVLQLDSDPTCGYWNEPLHFNNASGVFRYRVNPRQPIIMTQFNCASNIIASRGLRFQSYDTLNSASNFSWRP